MMDFFAQYKITPAEAGITDMAAFQEKFDTVAPLVIAYAEATATAMASLKVWISWIRQRNSPQVDDESKRLCEQFEADEDEQTNAYAALQVALIGEEAWQEVLRLEQQEKDAECDL
jgi:hypothetical protein